MKNILNFGHWKLWNIEIFGKISPHAPGHIGLPQAWLGCHQLWTRDTDGVILTNLTPSYSPDNCGYYNATSRPITVLCWHLLTNWRIQVFTCEGERLTLSFCHKHTTPGLAFVCLSLSQWPAQCPLLSQLFLSTQGPSPLSVRDFKGLEKLAQTLSSKRTYVSSYRSKLHSTVCWY